MRVRDREPIGAVLRRFKKLLDAERLPEGDAPAQILPEAVRGAPPRHVAHAERYSQG
jgi:hypothetical protein